MFSIPTSGPAEPRSVVMSKPAPASPTALPAPATTTTAAPAAVPPPPPPMVGWTPFMSMPLLPTMMPSPYPPMFQALLQQQQQQQLMLAMQAGFTMLPPPPPPPTGLHALSTAASLAATTLPSRETSLSSSMLSLSSPPSASMPVNRSPREALLPPTLTMSSLCSSDTARTIDPHVVGVSAAASASAAGGGSVDSGISSNSSADLASRRRRRRLTDQMTPEELARTREINRIAARRHRAAAKQDNARRVKHLDNLTVQNRALATRIAQLRPELRHLRNLIRDLRDKGQLRHVFDRIENPAAVHLSPPASIPVPVPSAAATTTAIQA